MNFEENMLAKYGVVRVTSGSTTMTSSFIPDNTLDHVAGMEAKTWSGHVRIGNHAMGLGNVIHGERGIEEGRAECLALTGR